MVHHKVAPFFISVSHYFHNYSHAHIQYALKATRSSGWMEYKEAQFKVLLPQMDLASFTSYC